MLKIPSLWVGGKKSVSVINQTCLIRTQVCVQAFSVILVSSSCVLSRPKTAHTHTHTCVCLESPALPPVDQEMSKLYNREQV